MRVWTADNVPLPLPRLWSFLSVPVQFQRQQRGRRLCRTLIDSAGPDCDTHRAQSWNYHFIRYIRPKPVWFYDGFHLCTPHLPVLCVSSGSGYLWPGGVRQTTTSNYNGFAMPSACKHYYGTVVVICPGVPVMTRLGLNPSARDPHYRWHFKWHKMNHSPSLTLVSAQG